MICENAHDLVLDRLFLRLRGLIPETPENEVLLKIEGLNPAGSIKLKTAVGLIEDAENCGLLKPGSGVIESSSGNLGVALASVCAAKGYAFTCVTDPNTAPHNVALMHAFGAEVVCVDRRDANGGFLQSRIDHIQERLAADDSLLWLNQYANRANPRVHYERTAAAIVAEVGAVDYLFVGAGTTGTLMGCAGFFREFSPRTRIIAVDAPGSVTFGHPAGPRHIPGLGTSRRPELCRPELVDEIVLAPESEAIRMCRFVARTRGVAVGGSTGSVLAAVARRGREIPAGATVVALAPDMGERYLETLYDDAWVEERYGPEALNGPLSFDDRRPSGGELLLKG